MRALRYLYLLTLVVWLGGMVTLGALAAPAAFEILEAYDPEMGRVLAGDVFGEILRRFHFVAYGSGVILLGCLGAMATRRPRPRALGVRAGIVGAMLVISICSGVWVSRAIEELQQDIGAPISTLQDDDPRRARFGMLHGLSTILMGINLAGGLVLVYWEGGAFERS